MQHCFEAGAHLAMMHALHNRMTWQISFFQAFRLRIAMRLGQSCDEQHGLSSRQCSQMQEHGPIMTITHSCCTGKKTHQQERVISKKTRQ